MIEGILTNQIRGDPEISGMLARYKDRPAFFFQKSPQDNDRGWDKPTYPRVDYNLDMRYDPERKAAGTMTVNVFCTAESEVMPEDIERRVVDLVDGTFYTNQQGETACAVWNRSDAFQYEMPANVGGNTAPEVFGITATFDLLLFPEQVTTTPDPVQSLNRWTRFYFPGMTVVAHDKLPPLWRPTDENPAIYWRFGDAAVTDRQTYAVDWYLGQFAAHIIAESVTERNRWIKAIIERIQVDGEVLLTDGSPMFAKQIAVRHSADPLRDGQLILSGRYGVLAQYRREYAQPPLNRATVSENPCRSPYLRMEVNAHGKEHRQGE